MSESIQQKAQAALAEVEELTAIALREPATEIVTLEQADAPVEAEIRRRMDELDMGNTNSIVSFGSAAQAELQEISQAML